MIHINSSQVASTKKEVDTVYNCYNQYEDFLSNVDTQKPSTLLELFTKQNEEVAEMEKECARQEMIINELWTNLESEMYNVIKK